MYVNESANDPAASTFLVLERWGGMDNAASYREQAQSLRRSLDSIEFVEKSYAQNNILVMHKPVVMAGMVTVVTASNNAELDAYTRRNAAHARMAHDDRQVLPLTDWDTGRAELTALVRQMESMAAAEDTAVGQDKLRPLDER